MQTSIEKDSFASFRGAADGLALRIRLSDPQLHQNLRPENPVERLLFELFEQFRVEALTKFIGMRDNLRHRHEAWSLQYYYSGLTETAHGMLLYTALQMVRSRVCGEPVVEETDDRIESTRAGINPLIGNALQGLRKNRWDQTAYAPFALAIAKTIAQMIVESDAQYGADERDSKALDKKQDQNQRDPFKLLLDVDGDDTITPAQNASRTALANDTADSYHIYTKKYDTERKASSFVRADQLDELRERLDGLIASQAINVSRVARQLKAKLLLPTANGWDSAQEEGRIDGRTLSQLIASPTERRLFKTQHIEPQANAIISLLIDCSGSMKQHIESVAILIDVFTRAMGQAGIACEVLGFTTGGWAGGKAARDWRRAGKPANPGRLNEVSHLIFKDAQTPWRIARRDIAALLKGDLFREGIDGEGVDWACDRVMTCWQNNRFESQTSESQMLRRIVMVISDGCPMDSATNLANHGQYLDQNLRDVVDRRSRQDGIEIIGIGVGLDLSPYYKKSHIIELGGHLQGGVFNEIVGLIA